MQSNLITKLQLWFRQRRLRRQQTSAREKLNLQLFNYHPDWLEELPTELGIRHTVQKAVSGFRDLDGPDFQHTVIGTLINYLHLNLPMPRLCDWENLFSGMQYQGPVVLMTPYIKALVVDNWFTTVYPAEFLGVIHSLSHEHCRKKYLVSSNSGAVGWSTRNPRVQICLFNVRNHAIIAQAKGRIQRPASN